MMQPTTIFTSLFELPEGFSYVLDVIILPGIEDNEVLFFEDKNDFYTKLDLKQIIYN
jgi:hypothetical protein